MKLNIFLSFYLLLGCGLFICCQNVQRNFELLDNPSHNVLEKIKYSKELGEYLENNRNKRHTDVNDRSFKILKNFHSNQELPNLNYKSSSGPNNIREMKILRKVDYYLPHKNENENFTPKTTLESQVEGKGYRDIKNSKNFNKNPPGNKIKRESPEIFGYTGSTKTKKRISSADKFLNLDEKERERLLEKVLNEINRKLNRSKSDNNYTHDDEFVEKKPHLLILNSKSKPKRDGNSETEPFVWKAVENANSSKTYASIPSGPFNDATEAVILPDLKPNPDISSIGKQTGRSNVNIEDFTGNSKNFSKREDKQYQTDETQLTTFVPETREQKLSMKEPMELRRVHENKSEMNNKDGITSGESEKAVKKRDKNGELQLYQILKTPPETNKFGQSEGSSDTSKMSKRTNNDHAEDRELLEYIQNNVKNCLLEMRKDVKEEKEKPEMKEENPRDETTIDTKENYPKEIPPQMTDQLSLFEKLNNLNPNSPGFQLLWNILQSTSPKPNILLGENQKDHVQNVSPHKSPLIAEENYLDEVSSEETGNDPYDMIFQTEYKNLDELARTYTRPNMGATGFDRFWETDLLDELLF